MSAIWGMIDLHKRKLDEDIKERMEKPYRKCCIDDFKYYLNDFCYLAYGGQFFTKESRYEQLPLNDTDLMFTADVVLDNRMELLKLLDVPSDEKIPDGTIMFNMLKQYGEESYCKFLGTYAFCDYDKQKNTAVLVSDSVGSRTLYYSYEDGRLIFSTMLRPIVEVMKTLPKYNYRWISDYLSINNLALFTECEETYYEGIYKMMPGTAMEITLNGLKKISYWNPLEHIKVREHIKDEECDEEIRELFSNCVKDTLRTDQNIGILLSGGLDSSTVASYTAPVLKSQGRQLYSFTYVPKKEYNSKVYPDCMVNERGMIEEICKFFENIEPTYVDIPDINPWDGADKMMDILESPYKSLLNLRWIYASMESAANKNCKLMLTGQFGNLTISYGDFMAHYNALIKHGKLISLVHEINAFHRNFKFGRKSLYKQLLHIWSPKLKEREKTDEELLGHTYLNSRMMDKYQRKEHLKEFGKVNTGKERDTLEEIRPRLINKIMFSQIGEYETKFSLATGVLMRDPTKDRRIIEYCLSLPDREFMHNGVERRLVREYLGKLMPPKIVEQIRYRGMQSADISKRIELAWSSIREDILNTIEQPESQQLLDVQAIIEQLKAYDEKLPEEYNFELTRLLYSVLACKFFA